MPPSTSPYPLISIVDFHHARGPEIEHWIGITSPEDISDWPLLPFLALADGAHSSEEDFSYFTLKYEPPESPDGTRRKPTTLFGISCTRQLDSRELIERSAEITRSTVQKAVVVIAESPVCFFGHLRQQLSAVTQAWFAQRDFSDLEIMRRFQESLKTSLAIESEKEQYVGLSLREIVFEYKSQALVLFKCMLLQPKMLFFATRCERLCMVQFSLLSLIPGLLKNLQDAGSPELNSYEESLVKPTSVKTSDRKSLLAFMGLPLQLFGKGSLFGPYTPLQQLDVLSDAGTKSYIVGSTNSLLLQQRDRYSDILINLDEGTINITSTSLRNALVLSAADRRWIDYVVQSVAESWDENDPSRPITMGFVGSEDYIRLQFEEYILSMVSAVKYHIFLEKNAGSDVALLPDIDGDPSLDFNPDFVEYWMKTENFRIFQKFTEPEIFDLVPPKHVMAGGLSIEDVQRRISQQVQDLHLDEKLSAGKEAAAKAVSAGRTNLSLAFMNISKNVEKFREQRRSQEQAAAAAAATTSDTASIKSEKTEKPEKAEPENAPAASAPVSPTVSETQTQSRAGAYISSWTAWAGEKRKKFASGSATASSTEKSEETTPTTETPPSSARPSLFARWSRSSVDLPEASKDKTRETHSVEITRETVWEAEDKKEEKAGDKMPEEKPSEENREEKTAEEKPVEDMSKALPPSPTEKRLPMVPVEREEEKELPAVPTEKEIEKHDEKERKEESSAPEHAAEAVDEKRTESETPAVTEPARAPSPEPKPAAEASVPTEEPIKVENAAAITLPRASSPEPERALSPEPTPVPAQAEAPRVPSPEPTPAAVTEPMNVDEPRAASPEPKMAVETPAVVEEPRAPSPEPKLAPSPAQAEVPAAVEVPISTEATTPLEEPRPASPEVKSAWETPVPVKEPVEAEAPVPVEQPRAASPEPERTSSPEPASAPTQIEAPRALSPEPKAAEEAPVQVEQPRAPSPEPARVPSPEPAPVAQPAEKPVMDQGTETKPLGEVPVEKSAEPLVGKTHTKPSHLEDLQIEPVTSEMMSAFPAPPTPRGPSPMATPRASRNPSPNPSRPASVLKDVEMPRPESMALPAFFQPETPASATFPPTEERMDEILEERDQPRPESPVDMFGAAAEKPVQFKPVFEDQPRPDSPTEHVPEPVETSKEVEGKYRDSTILSPTAVEPAVLAALASVPEPEEAPRAPSPEPVAPAPAPKEEPRAPSPAPVEQTPEPVTTSEPEPAKQPETPSEPAFKPTSPEPIPEVPVKRLANRFSQVGATPSPAPEPKKEAPRRLATSSSLAARRAMFEKK